MTVWADLARRQIGLGFDLLGIGPREAPHRIVLEAPGARLRAYHDANASGPVVFIIPAPFKRPYIWDLAPQVSVACHCLRQGFRVFLVEWLLPTPDEDGFGLLEYTDCLPSLCVDAIEYESDCSPILIGHSIGGTFAAIFAALFPERVRGLALLDSPLAFAEHGGPLARAVTALPHARLIRLLYGSPVPGSVIGSLCAIAAPEAFQLQRQIDLAACLCCDPGAFAIHARVDRWTYDEFPMPGSLFEDIVEQLYREDLFVKGALQIGGRRVGVADLRGPVIAVINKVGRIVPPASVLVGLAAAPNIRFELLEYDWQRGAMLQHLGPLVTPAAHTAIWPKILDWAREVGCGREERSRLPRPQ